MQFDHETLLQAGLVYIVQALHICYLTLQQSISAVRSLMSLCRIVGSPPVQQVKVCSTVRFSCYAQTQWALEGSAGDRKAMASQRDPLYNTNLNIYVGHLVGHSIMYTSYIILSLNLPKRDNLSTKNKSTRIFLVPKLKVSFVWRFHCYST